MNIVLLGAPGSGKGTVAELLVSKKNFFHLSTGNALREMSKKHTDFANELNEILKSGKLVSDDIVNQIVKETINELDLKKYHGLILDGYPRTQSQALYLKNLINIDKVLFIKVPDEVIEKRIINRRTCAKCGRIYNLVVDGLKPKNPELCDDDDGILMQRKDDEIHVIKDRLNAYYKEINPLIDFYIKENLLVELDGTIPLDEWKELILNSVK